MSNLRLKFKKTGRAVYISHLDLMRTMQRSFSRAGLTLKYSEGFNPHPKISILLPLSVGCASCCELMDFSVNEDFPAEEIVRRLNTSLPEGIEAVSVYEPVMKCAAMKWLRVKGRLEYDNREAAELLPLLEVFFSSENIPVEKKSKRGTAVINLKEHMPEISVKSENGAVILEAVISVSGTVINPDVIIAALKSGAPELAPDFSAFERICLYNEKFKEFI